VAGRRWSKGDDEALVEAIAQVGVYDLLRLADMLGRTQNAVQQRISKGPAAVKKAVQVAAEKHRKAQMGLGIAAVADRPDPTDSRVLKLERQLSEAQSELRDYERKLKALHKQESLFEQVAGVVREVVQPLPALKSSGTRLPDVTAGDRTCCDFVLILADEHADEVVSREATWGIEQYDYNIFRVRLQRLRDLVRDYATVHLPRHRAERLWVFKLGDSVNGDIHGHGPKNHFANTIKSAIAVGDAEAQFVQSLIPYFPLGVHVVGVSGNHARKNVNIKKDYDDEGPHDSFDYLVGIQMATRLANEIAAGRCSVTLPKAWSAYVEVRNMIWALNHGDDVTSYTGLPFVGFDRRNNRVQSMLGRVRSRADAFVAGHFHMPAAFPSAGGTSYHSGCWVAADPYALNRLAAGGEPQQLLLVVGDKPRERGILLPIPLYLRHEETEVAYREGTYQPDLGQSTALDSVTPEVTTGLHIVRAP